MTPYKLTQDDHFVNRVPKYLVFFIEMKVILGR